ncbi:MAG: hypothetical protein ACLRL3_00650 [Bifidobacterium adolescentis]
MSGRHVGPIRRRHLGRRVRLKPEAKTESKSDDVVTIDGKDYCSDTKVESATDDWNGVAIAVARRRRKAVTAGAEHASDDAQ